ncbi:divergent protein kinase domain 1C-like [Ptychodera flava]|uniref:divergent protein kinase domain 1C-like n=1 Tax=Ptychodera flava TaxID=63121 RepID=UPI00396A8132
MRLQRRQLIKAAILLFILVIVVYVFYHGPRKILRIPERCTDEQSYEMLQHLCDLYSRNKVDGNLCPSLCQKSTLKYKSCLYFGRGKKVLLFELTDDDVIFKSKHSELDNYYHIVFQVEQDGKTVTQVPDPEMFLDMVYNTMSLAFDVDREDDRTEMVKKMWTKEVQSVDAMTVAEKESLWSLLQQDEYLLMKYFDDRHLPKIFGSCGHFYAMEYVPTGALLNPSIFSLKENLDAAPWLNRARLALGFLDLIANLDTGYGQVMHLCDVKNDNFGVRHDFSVVAIDVDMAFLEKHMQGTLKQPNCTTNEECDFFDCLGNCDFEVKQCLRHRKDNNLQAVCRKIFMARHGLPGLLRYPPHEISEEVEKLLTECVAPSDVKQLATETEVYKKLYQLLSDSLNKQLS